MKIISWNVNGIRAIDRKGNLAELIEKENPDILFLQEIKAKQEQLSPNLKGSEPYEQHYFSAEKAGYSGTGLWVRPSSTGAYSVKTGIDKYPDNEGRMIRIEFGNYILLGGYFPNGGKSEEAWQQKLVYYEHFLDEINSLRKSGKKIIFTGDLNVAHNEIDLARPKENMESIGFLPEERAWVDKLISQDWVDVFRAIHPEEISYTWWSMQTRARERNIGWRIDYFFVDRNLFSLVQDIRHLNDQMGSDHCPVVLSIDIR